VGDIILVVLGVFTALRNPVAIKDNTVFVKQCGRHSGHGLALGRDQTTPLANSTDLMQTRVFKEIDLPSD
jgi:hypothetical protein